MRQNACNNAGKVQAKILAKVRVKIPA